MGLVTWFRRTFIVPRVAREVDRAARFPKGTTMNFLKGWLTIIAALGGLCTAIVAFANGSISFQELMIAISAFLAAIGVRRAIANAKEDIKNG
jgi:hypothetical protein